MASPDIRLKTAEQRLAAGDAQGAHRLCLEILLDTPGSAGAYFLLGVIAADHGVAARAAELLGRAVALDPAPARHHAYLARAHLALNDRDAARAAVAEAIARQPADALSLDLIGVTLSRLGDHAAAIGFFERAAARNGGKAALWYNLAASRQFCGDFEGAAAAYRRALELDPDLHRAWSALIQLSRQTVTNNRIAELETRFARAGSDPDRALHLGHALAKTFEDLGDDPTALTWLEKAKTPKRGEVAYDNAATEALFAAAARTTDAPRTSGASSDRPIFIVGLPRTGTTLVDRILSSHPEVASAGELTTFALAVKRAAGTPSNLVLDTETLDAAQRLDMAAIGAAYLAGTSVYGDGSARLIDKLPLNFFYGGLIHRALPDARIICLRRHPLDATLSNYRQLFATSFQYYHYALSLEDTARYYVLFDRLIAHWRATLPANRFTEVAYEDLVAHQERESRRLIDFCGLAWDDACLDFHRNAAPVSTASSVQVREPIYATSVGRWRRYGSAIDPARAVLEAAGLI